MYVMYLFIYVCMYVCMYIIVYMYVKYRHTGWMNISGASKDFVTCVCVCAHVCVHKHDVRCMPVCVCAL